ncbi:MAG: hypothetical protein PHN69_01520 [Candidatus Pacebacteria bacterium]|nr:hypothetical protein [Candidatus Paceibacterota bacterium]
MENDIEKNKYQYIEQLEKFSTISPQGKFLILVTYLGLKPVSEFQTHFINISENEEKYRKVVEEMLDGLNLYHSYATEWDIEGNPFISFHFLISKEQNLLDNLKYFELDKQARDKTQGESFGFPKTAVDGYLNNDLLENYESLITEEDKKFLFFRLSKKGWREEIEWLREMIKKIKEISPEIYLQVLNRDKK